MENKLQEIIKEEIYKIIDSFLVEVKDQYGKERSIEQLNQDKHLTVKRFLQLFEEIILACEEKEIEAKKTFYLKDYHTDEKKMINRFTKYLIE